MQEWRRLGTLFGLYVVILSVLTVYGVGPIEAVTKIQVNTTDAQTLTNKTLTAPTLTSPAFSGTASGSLTGLALSTPTLTNPAFSGTATGILGGLTLSAPVFSGTATGTYTLGGSPSLVAAVLSGTMTGTYTLGGTPTIASPVLSGTATGIYTLGGTPTITSPTFAGSSAAGALNGSYVLSTTHAGPHGIGTAAPATSAQVTLGGLIWGPSGLGAISTLVQSQLQPDVNTDGTTLAINGSIREAASGTHGHFTTFAVAPPSVIPGSASVVNATTALINGPPSAVGATNRALWVTSGLSEFGGPIAATGGQITFPATQNASANTNTLDDYEEGTWTPTLTFATPGNVSVAYSIRNGRYTKIGRQVTATVAIVTSTFTHTTASGGLNITGLPFASAGTSSDYFMGSMFGRGITMANRQFTPAVIGGGSTLIQIAAFGSGVSEAFVSAAEMPTGGVVTIYATVVYEAN